ncbi:unnamed protein product [Schistosoma curassoni]|uniref:Ovule protein n=1 Tax=Schistosoma curassoni TaxID=6186 RepID=A0A183JW02_9TREM|nr:unnamed protein product [Schistosoma curassoni]
MTSFFFSNAKNHFVTPSHLYLMLRSSEKDVNASLGLCRIYIFKHVTLYKCKALDRWSGNEY